MLKDKQVWKLEEIISNAKAHSPYYRELYKNCKDLKLSSLPVVDQAVFWKSSLLTSSEHDGLVFKSGGSTGAPKYSYFTNQEWESFTAYFGHGMSEGILESGDRVANLFYVGDLYASFLFIKDSLQSINVSKMSISQFPIAGQTDHYQILKTLDEFKINVIVGVPSAILSMLEKYNENKSQFKNLNITKILFGGEALYDDQFKAFTDFLPGVKISSIGCASVDGGLIGFSSRDCNNGEHRVFDGANIIEIVDPETNEVIMEKNRTGKVLLTNLTRMRMPIIRYPAGDLACWVEDAGSPNRKFKLQGRSDEAARLGTLSVYFEDTREMISKLASNVSGLQFQMILKHHSHKDELILRLSCHDINELNPLEEKITEAFSREKTAYGELLKKDLIHPLKIEIVSNEKLESNSRTGKLKRIIDCRA
ncbi:MAG: hypothetical protein HOP07_07610 [Bacteriovoracaceae bacterium]|nr:hypothetical protein [Bacteriovoracaceae bacterium]